MRHAAWIARRFERIAGAVRWGLVAGAAGALVLVAVLLAVIVYLPPHAIDSRGLSRSDWLTHVESLRTTLLQGLGGLALLGTLYFSARTLRLNRRGQLTERFSKAIEQLGSDTLAVRLGGIYALEQIAFDSAELHWPVMEVLSAYLRQFALFRPDAEDAAEVAAATAVRTFPADHQAIATVLGRRQIKQDRGSLDLRYTELSNADLDGADLRGATLYKANLSGATLTGADLRKAILFGSYLVGTLLRGADLRGAVIIGATFFNADLREANVGGLSMELVELQGAMLHGADLRAAGHLTLKQLTRARGADEARLPDDLAKGLEAARHRRPPRRRAQSSAAPPKPAGDERS